MLCIVLFKVALSKTINCIKWGFPVFEKLINELYTYKCLIPWYVPVFTIHIYIHECIWSERLHNVSHDKYDFKYMRQWFMVKNEMTPWVKALLRMCLRNGSLSQKVWTIKMFVAWCDPIDLKLCLSRAFSYYELQ